MALTKEQREQEILLQMQDNNKLSHEKAAQIVDEWDKQGYFEEPASDEVAPWEDPTVSTEMSVNEVAPWEDASVGEELSAPSAQEQATWVPQSMEDPVAAVKEARTRSPEAYAGMTNEEVQAELEKASSAPQEAPQERSIWGDVTAFGNELAKNKVTTRDVMYQTELGKDIYDTTAKAVDTVVNIPNTLGEMATEGLQSTDTWYKYMMEDDIRELLLGAEERGIDMSYDEAYDIVAKRQQKTGARTADAIALALPMARNVKGLTTAQKMKLGATVGGVSEGGAQVKENIREDEDVTKGLARSVAEGALLGGALEGVMPAIRALKRPSSTIQDLQKAGAATRAAEKEVRTKQKPYFDEATETSLQAQRDIVTSRKADVDTFYADSISDVEARRAAAKGAPMSAEKEAVLDKMYDDELSKLKSEHTKAIEDIDASSAELAETVLSSNKEARDEIWREVMLGREVAPGITPADLVTLRDKVGTMKQLSDLGAEVSVSDVASQVDNVFLQDFARKLGTKTERAAEAVPFVGDLLGLRRTGSEMANKKAVQAFYSGMGDTISEAGEEALKDVSRKGVSTQSTKDAIEYLKERLNKVKSNKPEAEIKASEKDFTKAIDKMSKEGVHSSVITDLNTLSRDMKAVRKLSSSIESPVKTSQAASLLGPGALIAADIFAGTGGLLTLGKTVGASIAQTLGKKGAYKWKTWSSKRKLEEINKALNGQLQYTDEVDHILSKEGNISKAIMRVLASQQIDNMFEGEEGIEE